MNTKRVKGRSDIVKDSQNGAVLATPTVYNEFKRKQQLEKQVNNLEKRMDTLEGTMKRIADMVSEIYESNQD